jgi:hypothetical protein
MSYFETSITTSQTCLTFQKGKDIFYTAQKTEIPHNVDYGRLTVQKYGGVE